MKTRILDDYQKTAIYFPPAKSVIVEAPPGHGKTFVMARRIEYLLQSGFIHPPHCILGLTFTNAAAGEMLDDIRSHLSLEQQSQVKVMTFHSLCYKVLHAYGNLIELDRNFVILGELQQQKALKLIISSIISKPIEDDRVRDILEAYFLWVKEKILKMDDVYVHPTYQEKIDSITIQYNKKLDGNLVDYNYLLVKTIDLFKTYPYILELYRSSFRYILVDEFQDTNSLQFHLLSRLVFGDQEHLPNLPVTPIFILTDRDQAIFRFQGADPENAEKAKDIFGCDEISLKINYRTTSPKIIALIQKMRKVPITVGDGKIDLSISQTTNEEALLILKRIKEYQGAKHDICVIAQSSYNFGDLKNLFDVQSIPYVFVPDYKAKSVELKYGSIFEEIGNLVNGNNTIGKLATRIQKIIEDGSQDWQNDDVLCALLDLARKFERSVSGISLSEKARQFYNDIFIEINWGNVLRKRVRNKVFLSTIHGVKGLQFNQVHITGLVNYEHIHSSICYPCNFGKEFKKYINLLKEPYSTLYVGVSRAQQDLFLYAVRKNSKNKDRIPICILWFLRDRINIPQSVVFCSQAFKNN